MDTLKKSNDAVDILHKRYIGDDPERKASIEEERAIAEEEYKENKLDFSIEEVNGKWILSYKTDKGSTIFKPLTSRATLWMIRLFFAGIRFGFAVSKYINVNK